MQKWPLVIISVFLALLFASTPARSAAEFEVDYQTLYNLDAVGETKVVHQIALTNKLSTVYATKFNLEVGLTDVREVMVRDSQGQILPQISQTAGQTYIGFEFIDKVVGKGKINNFSISYQTRDIVSRNGSIWEINIPRLEGEHAASTYGVILSVPAGFGPPAFVSPKPDSVTNSQDGNFKLYHFAPHLGFQSPITAVFGRTQYMEFQLRYHLENTGALETSATIALPPDTAYQQVAFKQLEPRPLQVETDPDGNWLATYRLSPGQLLTVSALGVAKLEFEPNLANKVSEVSEEYLLPRKYWESDQTELATLAQKLKTPKAIYQYLVDHLSYSYERVSQGGGRLGALEAFRSPDLSTCTEFTDLFIALARAAGIPARELEGYAFTTNDRLRPLSLNQDVLHAWPEFFDFERGVWVQIDPTWGKTTGGVDYFNKLDLNHFVFVIHGLDPTSPAPAGAYKLKSDPQKDVQVSATTAVVWPPPEISIGLVDENDLSHPELSVKNVSQVAAANQLTITSEPPGIINESIKLQIPPYGNQIVTLKPKLPWSIKPVSFTLNIDDGQKTVTLAISAKKPLPPAAKVSVLAGLGILGATALVTGRLRFRGRGRHEPLHW